MGHRRLYRSRQERMIAGVAGGLAEYFDVDVRLSGYYGSSPFLWVGCSWPILIAWFMIPEQPFGGIQRNRLTWKRTESQTNPEEHDTTVAPSGVIRSYRASISCCAPCFLGRVFAT